MPDMAALNIINLNIDSIQKEIRNCKTEGKKYKLLLRSAHTETHILQSNEITMVKNTKAKQTN